MREAEPGTKAARAWCQAASDSGGEDAGPAEQVWRETMTKEQSVLEQCGDEGKSRNR